MTLRHFILTLALVSASVLPTQAQNKPDTVPPGVRGDGIADDTVAIQAALNTAAVKGGEVYLPSGQYLIKSSLTIPTGVVLRGSWEEPHHGAYKNGSTLLITGGRNREDGPAAIELQQSSALKGFTMLWPEQRWDAIVPYPWAIHGVNMHNTVENVTFVNAYQGIKIGQPFSELHLIRNVFGCVLRRGIFIDTTSDIGRIENVHFNPHYWQRSGHPSIAEGSNGDRTGATARYMEQNLEAFIFGRTDWEYVTNTFVYAAKIGYRFIGTPAGACNGQLLGIGADDCQTCVQLDTIQDIGLQITNGEFTSFAGDPNTAIRTSPGAAGAAQFVNCNFWMNRGHVAWLQGNTAVTLSDCHIVNVPPSGAILAERGKLIVRGCNFSEAGPAILLRPAVTAAIIVGNLQAHGLRVANEIGERAQIGLNETPFVLPTAQAQHYKLQIGKEGDEDYIAEGWYGRESSPDGPGGSKTARWTSGDAKLKLPVIPGQAYTLRMALLVNEHDLTNALSIVGGPSRLLDKPGLQEVELRIPATATIGKQTIEVNLAGKTWSPHRVSPTDGDTRELGVRVFNVEMVAANALNGAATLNSLPYTKGIKKAQKRKRGSEGRPPNLIVNSRLSCHFHTRYGLSNLSHWHARCYHSQQHGIRRNR